MYRQLLSCFLMSIGIISCTRETVTPHKALEKASAEAVAPFPIKTMGVQELSTNQERYLIVDTRSEDEINVSKIPGAITWTDYKNSPAPQAITEQLSQDKPIVFYCSIGFRSGEAALRVAKEQKDDSNLYNLKGGIFHWANLGYDLQGGTLVHGYDDEWERLLQKEKRFPISTED